MCVKESEGNRHEYLLSLWIAVEPGGVATMETAPVRYPIPAALFVRHCQITVPAVQTRLITSLSL